MCAVFRRERHDRVTSEARVEWVDDDWSVAVRCDDCGGYRMALEVRREAGRELASARAHAFLRRVHAHGGCLACEARAWREGYAQPDGEFHVWWDTDSRDWIAWRRLPGVSAGVSVPLGIHTFWAPQEARAAARALWSSDRIPLRVAADPDAAREATAIYYDVEAGRWKLHVACFECGQFELSLTSFGRGAVEAACDEALGCLDLIAREGCPNCRTLHEREAQREGDEPCIWFDTRLRDWVLWQPLDLPSSLPALLIRLLFLPFLHLVRTQGRSGLAST
jgi:hypothetical protein